MGHRQHDYANVKGYLSHLDNYIYMLGARLSLRWRGHGGNATWTVSDVASRNLMLSCFNEDIYAHGQHNSAQTLRRRMCCGHFYDFNLSYWPYSSWANVMKEDGVSSSTIGIVGKPAGSACPWQGPTPSPCCTISSAARWSLKQMNRLLTCRHGDISHVFTSIINITAPPPHTLLLTVLCQLFIYKHHSLSSVLQFFLIPQVFAQSCQDWSETPSARCKEKKSL